MILAGDIGGTSTRVALAKVEGKALALDPVERYVSREHGGLGEIVEAFLAAHPASVDRACFGIAGPVREGRVETPNLPWIIEAKALSALLGGATVKLLNDLEANAFGVFTLGPGDFDVLNSGAPAPDGNAAILSAGTGLGEAGYHWDGRDLHPFASEGGHADFAARNDLEIELFSWLQRKLGHVSYERVLSGPGLVNIFTFLRDTRRGEEPPWLADEMRAGDPGAAISSAALTGTSPLAVAALDLFVSILGAEAGNLALKMKATRGVYLGGGIAPKILSRLKRPGFLEAFVDKGRFRAFMEAIPVQVILNEHTALRGAALCASLLA
ncbi:MAG TPA: glucokinase [Candidatus Polarisedimenticolaceae bacterium]|nr:glucokinase [Candidatus Polarisedimenticolaceae bacterium]